MERIEHFFLILIVLTASGQLVITENVVKNLDEGSLDSKIFNDINLNNYSWIGLNKPAIKEALDLIGIGDCLVCFY